jgi:hypothetical protein
LPVLLSPAFLGTLLSEVLGVIPFFIPFVPIGQQRHTRWEPFLLARGLTTLNLHIEILAIPHSFLILAHELARPCLFVLNSRVKLIEEVPIGLDLDVTI